jgi:hypothetical protein
MRKRLKTTLGAAAALAALALGGSAIASAGQAAKKPVKNTATKSVAAEPTGGADTDSIQSGDQTTPDTRGSAAKSAKAASATGSEAAGESSSETSSETSSESSAPSDGPGGHEDPEGNVDYQSEAQE